MIDPDTGWFKIVEVSCFNLDQVAKVNNEYTDKNYARVNHILNQTWLYIYPRPHEFVFENGSKFKCEFTPLLK